jgi:DNA-binding protein HU-beta|tara:strand:- start:2517 stop:2792 length:276 start_codon:yes stop_codon:yes gene_type:complete
MNKDDLISKVASTVGLSKTEAAKSVNAVFSNISGSLKNGNEVRLVGFGTFLVLSRAATTGRNPRTGESIQIPARKVPKFRAGKVLKHTVNN